MDEQTILDIYTMQMLFAKAEERIRQKGFSKEADEFNSTCKRLTEIIERSLREQEVYDVSMLQR